MNIILSGMPGSGKSYFGELAAKKMNRMFIDTDVLLMKRYFQLKNIQATCREIALKEGEPFFRDLETQFVKELESANNSIIAIGGGTLASSANAQILRNLGIVIYLKVPPETLFDRFSAKPSIFRKPDVQGSFEALLKQRIPLYEKTCHYCIDVSSENVLECIQHYANLGNCLGK